MRNAAFLLVLCLMSGCCPERAMRSVLEHMAETLPLPEAEAPDVSASREVSSQELAREDKTAARPPRTRRAAPDEPEPAGKKAVPVEQPVPAASAGENAVAARETVPPTSLAMAVPEPRNGSAVSNGARSAPAANPLSAWKGECLVYNVKWNFVELGKGLIACQETKNSYGNVYHLVGITVPSGMVANFGYGYNRVDSYVDRTTFKPYYFYGYMRNRTVSKITEVQFNRAKKTLQWETRKYRNDVLTSTKKGVESYRDDPYDGISAFYVLRTFDFNEKARYEVPVGITKVWNLLVQKIDRRNENIPGFGPQNIYILEPEASSDEGLFTGGKMTIWLTSDSRKLPVMFSGKTTVGSARLNLSSVRKLPANTVLDPGTLASLLNSG